jgi:hypothetical protein
MVLAFARFAQMSETDKGYEAYQEMIGTAMSPARKRKLEAAGVTSQSFDYSGMDNEWYCTVYFKDSEPVKMNLYVWSATKEMMRKSLSDDLGYEVEFGKWYGGNGHYSAELKRKWIKKAD